jgi:Protein of unknown function (DUF1670)
VAALRQRQIARMAQEALDQGALLTAEDHAFRIFNCGLRTISRDLKELAAQEECWQEARAPVTIMERTRRIPLSPRVDPPGNAVSTLGVAYDATAETGIEAYYALLMDGSVMWWRHESAHPYMILFGWLMPLLIALGVLALFVPIYLGAAMIGLKRRRESAA